MYTPKYYVFKLEPAGKSLISVIKTYAAVKPDKHVLLLNTFNCILFQLPTSTLSINATESWVFYAEPLSIG